MHFKARNIITAICLTLFIMLIALTTQAVFLVKSIDEDCVQAASDDLAFTVEVGIFDVDTGQWTPYHEGYASRYAISFKFEFTSLNANPNIIEFNYAYGTNFKDVKISADWKEDGLDNENLKPQNMLTEIEGEEKMIWTFPISESYDYYVKFRAISQTMSGSGVPVTEVYELNKVFHIMYDNTPMESDFEIVSVKAEHRSGTLWSHYDTIEGSSGNVWVHTQIRFEITSKNMQHGGSLQERFFYSVDGIGDMEDEEKQWHPATENIVVLEQNLDGPVHFKVTDQNGQYQSYYTQDQMGNPIYVKMDIVEPEFSVDAKSTKWENGELVEYTYNSNFWTYNSVTFIITPTAQCISPVSYEYSIDGGAWTPLTKSPNGDYYILVRERKTDKIEFKAYNSALLEYRPAGSYSAKIDIQQPIAYVTAVDSFNTAIKSFGTADGEGYRVGYASDVLNFSIFNRRRDDGTFIQNISETRCYYKYTYIDGSGQIRETEYAFMASNTDPEGHVYFTISDEVGNAMSIDRRVYTFRLESGAGLYDEQSFEATILNSDFEISIDPVSRVENEKGWSNAPIPVYVNVPIMDKYIFAYGISGAGYENFEKRFIWALDGSGDSEDVVKDVTAEYADIEEGKPGYVPPGMAKFRIYLTTSVERRYFRIYVYNAAEVKSRNEENTPEIRLDMVTPNVKIVANVQHNPNLIIESGEWANGNIVITMDSKALPENEISLSGIECELMVDNYIPDRRIESELDSDGLPIGKFIYTAEIPTGEGIYTKTLIFRLTSGSGLQNYIYYDVRIDKRDIVLNYVYDLLNEETLLEYDEVSPVYTGITSYVCKDIQFRFDSNHNGHFDYWYRIGNTGAFIRGQGDVLTVEIPGNSAGEIELQFYLESHAVDFENNRKVTHPFTLIIPYNCISVNISAAKQEQAPGYTIDANNWRNGPISFLIELPAGEKYEDYTYGIIILGDLTPGEFYAQNGLNEDNQKSEIYNYCTLISLNEGVFDFWGVDEYGAPRFFDPTGSTNKCFYTGNIMIFAFNKAKYSSNFVAVYSDEIRVDNSTPDVTDLIQDLNGEIDFNNVYNNETITLRNPQFTDRAAIDYYYFLVTTANPQPQQLPTSTELNGWTKLGANDYVNIGYDPAVLSVSYYLFARNSLGQPSSLNGEKYTFRVDPKIPEFNVTYPAGQGSDENMDIDGETYNVFTFTWAEQINIEFSTNSDTAVYYWYSFDNRNTWIKYNQTASDESNLTFVFSEDIHSTIFFKLTNQAGSEVMHIKPAVIRIDTKRPDFALETYVGGNVYNGGGYGSIDIGGSLYGLSLEDTSGDWASSAVTIKIKIDPENRNPSPVEYQYLVKTATGETQYVKTPSNVPINDAITFTTDRMDNFGKNNDAIIVVQARCPANGKIYTQAVRVKVDKVVPEFKVNGEVYISDTSNQTRLLNSGEWTNQEEVRLSIQRTNPVPNKSKVKIVYFREGSSLENLWPTDSSTGSSYGMVTITQSETIRVVATTESGLVYQQIFEVNIDTVPPQIESGIIVPSVTDTPNTYYIDQPIYYREENLKSAQYIVRPNDTVGFPLSQGHIIATNTVDNSEESKGYVKIIIEDLAGNKAELEFYMVPFKLDINNLTLSQEDLDTIDRYEADLRAARGIDDSRRAYFENLIMRLRDRENTLRQEIAGFQSYLAGLTQKASYELRSDYKEMNDYLTTYYNYEYYGQKWIQDAIVEGEYFERFQQLQEIFATLDKEMKRVQQVEENARKLPAINVVQVIDYNRVLQVYDSYIDLSPDQKAVFDSNLYNKIMSCKRICENMLLQDKDSGIKIEGNLAPGARIEVQNYPNTVEKFDEVQATLLNTVDSSKPRTVISVNKVGIKGEASQTSTGEILVNLPIPEEFYDYVFFSVYRLSPDDGTVSEIKGVQRLGDGKSVQFKTDSLGIYVLVTRANIAIKPEEKAVYGRLGDIKIDTQMLNYIAFATIGVFVILIVVVTITGLRRRRFLSHYNKEHKSSLRRKGLQHIPKGNKPPREHPFKDNERVKTSDKPIFYD